MAKPKRRKFTAQYRLRILEEAESCTQPGEVGLLLRREGHRAPDVLAKRGRTLQAAWALHPERFVHGTPKPAPLPEAVWINPPATSTTGKTSQ